MPNVGGNTTAMQESGGRFIGSCARVNKKTTKRLRYLHPMGRSAGSGRVRNRIMGRILEYTNDIRYLALYERRS